MSGSFIDRLASAVSRLRSSVVVGLDPRWDHLPPGLLDANAVSSPARASAYVRFCNGVIDVVASLVPAVKLQAAFFEELGPAGMAAMGEVIRRARCCGLLVILDGKRNDIGTTALAYARGYLGEGESEWGANAITVSPYLGGDSLAPFVEIATRARLWSFCAGENF